MHVPQKVFRGVGNLPRAKRSGGSRWTNNRGAQSMDKRRSEINAKNKDIVVISLLAPKSKVRSLLLALPFEGNASIEVPDPFRP